MNELDGMDRDTLIGCVLGSYKRLKEMDPSNELLSYMTIYPLSDEPAWVGDRHSTFTERFGDRLHRNGSVSTGTLVNYWRTLKGEAERIEIERLEKRVEMTLAHPPQNGTCTSHREVI